MCTIVDILFFIRFSHRPNRFVAVGRFFFMWHVPQHFIRFVNGVDVPLPKDWLQRTISHTSKLFIVHNIVTLFVIHNVVHNVIHSVGKL